MPNVERPSLSLVDARCDPAEAPIRLTERTYDALLRVVVDDALREGDKLPSEHELCRRVEASRPIVREALRRLQADGLIESRRGVGSFVRRRPPDRMMRHLRPDAISAHLSSFEIRVALECEASSLAASRRTGPQLAAIRGAYETLSSLLRAGRPSEAADLELHRSIVAACGNPLFVSTFEYLQNAVETMISTPPDMAREAEVERRRHLEEEHLAVVEAIDRGEPEAAGLAMRWHLFQARRRVTDATR
jgi:DNA-binding FadR family transcriptional regulator